MASFQLSTEMRKLLIDSHSYISFQSMNNFLKWFLMSFDKRYNKYKNITFNIYDIQEEDIPERKDNVINVIFCYENCYHYDHYKHFNKYGDFGDKNVDIYLYNHINDITITDEYIALPLIYVRMMFLQTFYNQFKPYVILPFHKRKFCILLTPNHRNAHIKQSLCNMLNTVGECHSLTNYMPYVRTLSIYTQDFLNFIHNFKFCIVCENSTGKGYITEKIFHGFYGRCVPIYWGTNPEEYFDSDCYIDAKKDINDIIKRVKLLNDNEALYNKVLKTNKLKGNVKKKTNNYVSQFFEYIDRRTHNETS